MKTLLMCDRIFETVQEVEYMYQYIWHHKIRLLLLAVDILFPELVNTSRESSPLKL